MDVNERDSTKNNGMVGIKNKGKKMRERTHKTKMTSILLSLQFMYFMYKTVFGAKPNESVLDGYIYPSIKLHSDIYCSTGLEKHPFLLF